MPNVGPIEVILVLIIVVLVAGSKRITELGRSLGKGVRGFKASVDGQGEDDEGGPAEPARLPEASEDSTTPAATGVASSSDNERA
jgi:sec-independent protein translocase protein TatA